MCLCAPISATMNDGQCPVRPNAPLSTSLFTNVTVVIDREWPFEDIKGLL